MSVETIVIESNGKFGPKVDGKFYSFSKFFKGNKELEIGSSVQVDVYESASGKKYINAVLGTPTQGTNVAAPKQAAKPKAAAPASMSKEEWQAKDMRISRQGVIQVSVQVTGNFDEAVVLADKMLAYVNQAEK